MADKEKERKERLDRRGRAILKRENKKSMVRAEYLDRIGRLTEPYPAQQGVGYPSLSRTQPTDADVTEAKGILADAGSSKRDRDHANRIMRLAKKLGVKEIVVPKNKGGPITKPKAKMMGGEYKKPQMKHGGVHKGKKYAYAAGGMVKDMNMMRNK